MLLSIHVSILYTVNPYFRDEINRKIIVNYNNCIIGGREPLIEVKFLLINRCF